MKRCLLLVVVGAAMGLTGCATYRESPLTPEGFNYTLQRDRQTGDISDYFGLSWNLKPERKK